jgi:hypothetical protein
MPSALPWAVAIAAVMGGWAGPAAAQGGDQVVFASDASRARCIVAARQPNRDLDVLLAGSCDDPAARFVFDERAKRIRLARDPRQCLNDATGSGDGPWEALVRACADENSGQFYAYDRGASRIVTAGETVQDGFCYYFAQPQGGRTRVLTNLCDSRGVGAAQRTFVMLPAVGAAAPAPGVAQAPAATAPGATLAPSTPLAGPPWGTFGPWTVSAYENARGFTFCRGARATPAGEIRIGLSVDLAISMSTPAPAGAGPGARFPITLTAAGERETANASISQEGRMGFTIPPPVARAMLEQGPAEITLQSQSGTALHPIAPFRPLWDALNACVDAKGRR